MQLFNSLYLQIKFSKLKWKQDFLQFLQSGGFLQKQVSPSLLAILNISLKAIRTEHDYIAKWKDSILLKFPDIFRLESELNVFSSSFYRFKLNYW
jgi:hypothetical protein